ncbi:MAG: ABC transporter substrate-binding protein [Candidatus Omnitrophica bacterium]|nr:ABC transporter substrate-binding protein [Candidatus Omnitrophota bacterium]
MAQTLPTPFGFRAFYAKVFFPVKGVLLAGLMIASAAVQPAYAAPSAVSSPKPRYGGTLYLGTHQKPAPLDPFNVTDTISAPLMDLIFNKLVRVSPSGEFEPDLAQRWEISKDGLTYTFYLRSGVKFHNGQECTSEDVLHSFRLMSDKNISPAFSKQFDRVKEWKIPSRYVFQAILKEPFSPFLVSIWRVSIVPKNQLIHTKDDLNVIAKSPIGTGPFIFEGEESNGSMRLRAYLNYFEGRPYLNQVSVQIFSSKKHVWSAFLRGDVDLVFYLDRDDFQEIRENSSFHVFTSLAPGGYMLLFNFKDERLKKRNLREAIRLAINCDEMRNKLEGDQGILIEGPFHPASWAYSSNIRVQRHPAESAARLLKEEGVSGLDLNLLVSSENEHLMRMAKLIRQQLQEIGISLKIHTFSDYKELHSQVYQPNAPFQIFLTTFNNMDPDPDVVSHYFPGGSFNLGNYENPEVSKGFEAARRMNDREERKITYHQLQETIAKDIPAVFLYIPYSFHASSKDIIPADNFFGPFIPFYLLRKLYKQE